MIELKSKHPRILVIGDLMIDHYLWGNCNRISPEAPVQVVAVNKENSVLGGAGNVVNNLKQLGAVVDIMSVVGQDEQAQELTHMLEQAGIGSIQLIQQAGRTTSKKSRVIAAHQQVLRFDKESTAEISAPAQTELLAKFSAHIDFVDIIVLSDYGKGVLTDFVTREIIRIARSKNKRVLVDPKGNDYSKYTGAYLLTPNKKEASEASKIDIVDKDSLNQAIQYLKDTCALDVSLITLSEEGIACLDQDLQIYPTVARDVFDVTGAGDTVIAALAFALGANYSIEQAIVFSNLAAGVVVGKLGSATATLDEIIAYEQSLKQVSGSLCIKTWDEIAVIARDLKRRGQKIVFTNGCFDLLHTGHARYLEQAREFGDVLIVGVNSDASVSRLKGPSRPINSEDDRAYILASLKSVDYTVIFHEDTPYELIKLIQPNVLVKGGDYRGKEVVGQDIAKEVKIVDFVAGKSTTGTIEKIAKS
ncbi:MAG: D-glycero-beta-D-manno-heptose-7-phosphate kinase [Burkholderiales bacterium]|nr:D-glycero-beta-D-manno-heptose-7-phosphate kinase [Burkholderiales bacterium]